MSRIAERRQEEKEQRRAEIIDAAEAVFARKGVDAATMGDIATQARLSRGLLYVYFNDKDDLALAITQRGFHTLRTAFEEAVAEHALGIDQIRAMGEAYVRFSQTHPLYFDMVARFEGREIDPAEVESNEAACLGEGRQVIELMSATVQRGIDDGTIRSDQQPERIALSLWGFTHGIIQLLAMKASMLERQYGIGQQHFVDGAFDLMGCAIAGPNATDHPPSPS